MVAPTTVPFNRADTAHGRSSTFHTFLADQPDYLVPERLIVNDLPWNPFEELVVSPDVWFTWRDHLPQTVEACYPLPEKFLQDSGLVWVDDPVTGLQRPFWAGPWFQERLAGAHRGSPGGSFSAHHRWVLFQAGVLVRPGETRRRSDEWQEALREASDRFQFDAHVRLPGLIHPFHLGALRRYYRQLVRTGGMTLGDNACPRRFVAHDESVARFFHCQLTAIVSTVVGVRVKPSSVCVASYQGGSNRPVHADSESCEYAASLLVDYTPEPFDQSPWPLYLESAKGTAAVWQAIGDAVLYPGRSLSHYRKPLADNATSTSLLFNYIDETLDRPLT
jgi:hypothetical protein